MGSEGWDDHDRSGKYACRDFARNYLNSCAPNAILITNGDNDTFPLWYAQEVEGVRTDVEILVRQAYTPLDVKVAEVKATEFRPSRYTSGSANLDDMIALKKAVILCDMHVRKFKPRAARYELHPAPNMRRVQGNCDVCRMRGPATLFLHESHALDERRKYEKHLRAMEYAHIVAQ